MANYRINGNDVHGVAATLMLETRIRSDLDDRRRDNIVGIEASKMLWQPTGTRNDQRNVHFASYESTRFGNSTSTGLSTGAAPTLMTGGMPRRSREDVLGTAPTLFSQSTQARTTNRTQYSTYSQIQSSPSAQSNTTNVSRTPLKTQSHKYVTPKVGSSQATFSPTYQNMYQQPNYSTNDVTVPMGVEEAAIDLISNAGSSVCTLGRELFQGKWT